MPLINIEYNNDIIPESDVQQLSEAIRLIIQETTEIEDVFVYGNSATIKVYIAPIEIFIQMSASKISNEKVMMEEIKNKLKLWKEENNFNYPINLTLIPMNWQVEINI